MKIISEKNIEKLKEISARHLGEILEKTKEKKERALLLLSGGSAFEMIKGIKSDYLGSYLTVGMLDERFETDPKINNFLQFKETIFYRLAKDRDVNFIESVPFDGEALESFAEKIENEWKNWRIQNSVGKIFITQGVGADGHTAGIMPYDEDRYFFKNTFEDKSRFVVGYNAGKKSQYSKRATATLPFLRNEVEESLVWIAGKEKIKAFNDIMSEDGSLTEAPARIIKEMKNATIFTNIKN